MLNALVLIGSLILTSLHTLPAHAQAENGLGQAKPYSEQPVVVQKAVRPEVRLHKNELSWSIDQNQVQGQLVVDLVFTTFNRFHLYENKMNFELVDELNSTWSLDVVQKPSPVKFYDPVSKTLTPGYQGQALFRLELKPKNAIAAQNAQKNSKLHFIVGFQACSDKVCLFPTKLLLEVDLNTTDPNTVSKSSASESSETNLLSLFSEQSLKNLITSSLDQSSNLAFLILFLAGVLTAFTPCVYPMYPITIGIFSRWGSEKSTSPVLLGFLYSLGITTSYALLGLITAATGSVFGSITQSPWFLISIGFVLMFSAVLFSGLIEFSLPTKLIDKITKTNSKFSPKSQSFIFGATLGVVASPCVGPVLIAVLSWTSAIIATQGINAYFIGFSYLSFFGLGMSFPFLVMTLLILKLQVTPSLGKWTPWIKKLGTLLLIASSLYFLIPGFKYLQIQNQGSAIKQKVNLFKTYSIYEAPKKKPWLIDFRADWCVACLEIESKSLTNPQVVTHFKEEKAALIKVDLTVLNDELQTIAKKYGVLSLPSLIFVNSDGTVCEKLNTFEFISGEDLYKKLQDPCMK